jgi:hypothetical protein
VAAVLLVYFAWAGSVGSAAWVADGWGGHTRTRVMSVRPQIQPKCGLRMV